MTSFAMPCRSLAAENMINVLRLIRTPHVGPVTFFQLTERFGNAGEALAALSDLSLRGGRKTPLIACPEDVALEEVERVEQFGARMILYGSPDYPRQLLTIPDPPPLITVTGNPHLWRQKDMVAMVGARNASANGCQFAHRLARDLGESGMIVASGLARGIDTFVHKGALATGTAAVIAGGIDNVYPLENEALYAQIRESGAIISEHAFGAIPFSGAFPGRNRILAGMSLGTVVVEASPKSGSLITARFAVENNREVFAVPGSPLDPRSKGCNQLIRQGATMVESASDILSGIAHLRNQTFGESPMSDYMPDRPAAFDDTALEATRRQVLEKLGVTPVSVDELIEQCQTPAGALLTVLLELELAGRLKRSPGNKVYLMDVLDTVALA